MSNIFRIMADLGLPIDTVEETPQTNCDGLPSNPERNQGFGFLIYALLG